MCDLTLCSFYSSESVDKTKVFFSVKKFRQSIRIPKAAAFNLILDQNWEKRYLKRRLGFSHCARPSRHSMSNQAFLARQRRIAQEAPEALFLESFTTKKPPVPTNVSSVKTLRQPKEQEPPPPRTAMRRFVIEPLQALNMMLNSKTVQTLLYAAFVFTTQLVIYTLRAQEEYYLDKFYTDTLM
jgi:hypothetical protein